MTSKQRAYLKKMAAPLSPIFQIGKNPISENMTSQISNALEAKELIKLHVLDNSEYTAREAADIISNKQFVINNGGHLNSESGYTKFEELLKYL